MAGVRKALAVLVGVILLGMVILGGMRLFNLAGGDVAWLRAIPWVVFIIGIIFLGGILYLLLRTPRSTPKYNGPPDGY